MLRALVSVLLMASTAALVLAPPSGKPGGASRANRRRPPSRVQRNMREYERERFKRTPAGWWDDVVSHPSPFALSQIFGAAEDLRAPCSDRVLLQLPNATDANGVVTDALSLGLSYIMVSVPSDTRVYLKGARHELQSFVDSVGDDLPVTITWGSGPNGEAS